MTPVQLPEVPAHKVRAHHIDGTEREFLAFNLDMHNPLPGGLVGQSVHVLTAAQLREYATEACRPLLDALEEIANYPELDALELKRIARAVLTPSETNSD